LIEALNTRTRNWNIISWRWFFTRDFGYRSRSFTYEQ